MSCVQGIGNFDSDIQDLFRGERAAPNPVLERLPLHQLHHDEGPILMFADVVNRADVGMVQCRGGPGFALEAFQVVWIPGVLLRQELDGYLTAQASVFGPG